MRDRIIMTKKELQRKAVLDLISKKDMSKIEGAELLGVTPRHLRRIEQRYRAEDVEGLIHKSRGKSSNRSYKKEYKDQIVSLYLEKYEGFGPTLAAEKLEEEDGIKVNSETLRLWLRGCGAWQEKRVRRKHCKRRQRRSRFGEMLQLDGSIHHWLPDSQKHTCLMNLVDDATGKTLSLMDEGETTFAALSLLKTWVELHGIPRSIYVDLKSLYVSPKSLKEQEDTGVEGGWLTHFSRVCKELGIRIIKAYSPQAKGRVERNHAVYQDRFVKELKLRNVKSIDQANEILMNGFIDKLNKKFMKEPSCLEDGHIPLRSDQVLEEIFCWEYDRQIYNDGTIRFENKYYQLEKSGDFSPYPKVKIKVKRTLEGKILLFYKDIKLIYREIEERPTKSDEQSRKVYTSYDRSQLSRANRNKTPWGQFNPCWLKNTRGNKIVEQMGQRE